MHLACICGKTHADDSIESYYYVSIRDGRKDCIAYGPFRTHARALAHVETVQRWCDENESRLPDTAPFWAFGTCRHTYMGGRLNVSRYGANGLPDPVDFVARAKAKAEARAVVAARVAMYREAS